MGAVDVYAKPLCKISLRWYRARESACGGSAAGKITRGRIISVSMPRSSGVIALVLTLAVALVAASAAAAGNGRGLGSNEPVRPDADTKIKGPKNKKDLPGPADT